MPNTAPLETTAMVRTSSSRFSLHIPGKGIQYIPSQGNDSTYTRSTSQSRFGLAPPLSPSTGRPIHPQQGPITPSRYPDVPRTHRHPISTISPRAFLFPLCWRPGRCASSSSKLDARICSTSQTSGSASGWTTCHYGGGSREGPGHGCE